MKRALSIIVLLGFLSLLINLIFIHQYMEQSLIVYVFVVLFYLLYLNKRKNPRKRGDM